MATSQMLVSPLATILCGGGRGEFCPLEVFLDENSQRSGRHTRTPKNKTRGEDGECVTGLLQTRQIGQDKDEGGSTRQGHAPIWLQQICALQRTGAASPSTLEAGTEGPRRLT